MFSQDKSTGKFAEEFAKAMPKNFTKVDAGEFFEKISAVKNEQEIDNVSKAGLVTSFLLKRLIVRIEDIVNDEEKVTHKDVASKLQEAIENEESKELSKFKKLNPDVEIDQIDTALPI